MMRMTRAGLALAVATLLAVAAPAHAAAPGATTRAPTAGTVRVTCTLVELKWPNGTGTGVWAMVCS